MDHRSHLSGCSAPPREFLVGQRRTGAPRRHPQRAAVGVRYERRGRLHTATARREIVLSTGAYGTPQLLQLSGCAEHLRTVGIDPVLDSPKVGQNLTDHPATFMNWELAPGFIGLADARNLKWLLRWLIRRSGKLTSNLMEALAHIRSAPGLPAPDFQLIHAPIYARIDELSYPRPALSILQSYWTPESRGSVLVRSRDAAVPPAIQLNMLTTAADLAAAFTRAIRRTREIVSTEPLASAVAREVHPGPAVNTDGELEAWIRATAATTGHPRVRRWAPSRTACSIRSCACGVWRACASPTRRRSRASRAPTPMARRS